MTKMVQVFVSESAFETINRVNFYNFIYGKLTSELTELPFSPGSFTVESLLPPEAVFKDTETDPEPPPPEWERLVVLE